MKKLAYLFLLIPQFYFGQCNTQASLETQAEIVQRYKSQNKIVQSMALNNKNSDFIFFEINDNFCVTGELVRTPNEKPFAMKTTSSRTPMYVKYGEILFVLNGKNFKLDVFQNLDMVKNNPIYKNSLFLAFTDLTSGVSTYGGGRYMDLTIPESNTIILDFNTAYNPYCAYSEGYSCPLTPEQNDLDIEILAGIKYQN